MSILIQGDRGPKGVQGDKGLKGEEGPPGQQVCAFVFVRLYQVMCGRLVCCSVFKKLAILNLSDQAKQSSLSTFPLVLASLA